MLKPDITILDCYKETIVNNKIFIVVMEEIDTNRPVIYGVYATIEGAAKKKFSLKKQFLHDVNVQIIKATLKA